MHPVALSFIGFVKATFRLPEVKDHKLALLSAHLNQDPLENYFDCQRQRGGCSDNPNVSQFYDNTQALRIVDSFCRGPIRGNSRGANAKATMDDASCSPLPKRPRK